jgi:predicted component of type VI protein secretion system
MDVRLVVERGGRQRDVFRMRGREMIIGRRKGCGLRVPSEAVSRDHCRLRFQRGVLTIEDLGSTNGTRLNGERIVTEELLRPGDRLKVGPVTFVVEYAPDPEALERMHAWEEQRGAGASGEFEFVEEEPPTLDAGSGEVELLEVAGDDSDFAIPIEEEAPVQLDEPLHLPPDDELRDFLVQLEEDDGF